MEGASSAWPPTQCECADTPSGTQVTERLGGSVPSRGGSTLYAGSWRAVWATQQGTQEGSGGTGKHGEELAEEWSGLPAVKGCSGCHGREKALQGQAGCQLQTPRRENRGSANVVREEGPPMPWGWAGRAEGAPLTVGPSVPPTGDPDPHLRFGGDARVVRGDAHPAPGAGHHGAGQQQHRVYAGRGLPRLQGGVLAPPPAPPAPATVPGRACVRNKPGATQPWPQFLLPAGDLAALQTPLLPRGGPQCGEGQLLRNFQQPPGQMCPGPRVTDGKPRPGEAVPPRPVELATDISPPAQQLCLWVPRL